MTVVLSPAALKLYRKGGVERASVAKYGAKLVRGDQIRVKGTAERQIIELVTGTVDKSKKCTFTVYPTPMWSV